MGRKFAGYEDGDVSRRIALRSLDVALLSIEMFPRSFRVAADAVRKHLIFRRLVTPGETKIVPNKILGTRLTSESDPASRSDRALSPSFGAESN